MLNIYLFATYVGYALLTVLLLCLPVIVRFYVFNSAAKLDNCGLYMGKVSHTRLKGGATHHFVYPLFFSYIDLEQISKVGWSLWPIFKLNGGKYSFCSLDEKDHLTDWLKEEKNSSTESNTKTSTLLQRALSFIANRTKGKKTLPPKGSINLMTHLTYFGYCFNPISVFYCLRSKDSTASSAATAVASSHTSGETSRGTSTPAAAVSTAAPHVSLVDSIIVEVSNTPWIEQHSYMLDESVENVAVTREVELKGDRGAFKATWLKEFHVSPFMEMDYRYNFTFSEPKETVWVQSNMTKLSTNEVWFNVNFELKRIPFTPLNLLYVLLFYPFFTRVIQVLIHYEAVKLFLKGVPTFNHPNGTPVEFGLGITDKNIIKFISKMTERWRAFKESIFGKTERVNHSKKAI